VRVDLDGVRIGEVGAVNAPEEVELFLHGRRVAEASDVTPTRVAVDLSLVRTRDGAVVSARQVVVDARESVAVTVLLSRSCANVECPGSGDRAATECQSGVCVSPECTPSNPAACPPEVFCAAGSECEVSGPECARGTCLEGACLLERDDALCAADELCAPEGCMPRIEPCADGTWDADGDPETECVPWTECGSGEAELAAGTATSDRACGTADACFDAVGVPCEAFDEGYLKASNAQGDFEFGTSVAISGDLLAVGSPGEASGSRGVGGAMDGSGATDSGAVYVFHREATGWVQEAFLKASDAAASDAFGWSVALDGDLLVVGAPAEARTGRGAAYVFRRVSGEWSEQARIEATDGDPGDAFGRSVAIAGDTVAVGAPLDDGPDDTATDSGAVHVFGPSGRDWVLGASLQASNAGDDDEFGTAVALAGDRLVVGAPGENSGPITVGGAEEDDSAPDAGAAHVFLRSGLGWTQEAYLKASNTGANDGFGTAVAIHGDLVVVGAPGESSATSSPLDDEAPSAGAAYTFARVDGSWTRGSYLKTASPRAFDLFGTSVAVLGDLVIVGAVTQAGAVTTLTAEVPALSKSGAFYLFAADGDLRLLGAMKAANIGPSDVFGGALGLSADYLVVGAPGEDGTAAEPTSDGARSSGAAYVHRVRW